MVLIYNNNTPQAAQTIASSQSEILTNFQSIDTAFNDANPLTFTKYAMQNVNSVAAPADPIGILHMLNGSNFFLNKPIPYFRNSVGDYPLLPDIKTVSNDKGFVFGNVIVNFGIVTLSAASNLVTLAIPFNNTNAFVGITPSSASQLGSSGPIAYSITTTQLTFRPATAMVLPITCSYFALGT